jgi:hypothetical protein
VSAIAVVMGCEAGSTGRGMVKWMLDGSKCEEQAAYIKVT